MFELADVKRAIVGTDFLHYFGLLEDVRRNCLVDPADNKVVKATPIVDSSILILSFSHDRNFIDFSKQFLNVTRESPVPKEFLHDIEHEIFTTGPPPLFS